jgi:hypothetical protein
MAFTGVVPEYLSGQEPAHSAHKTFLIESLGGTIGSLSGLVAGLTLARPDKCRQEDLECILQGVGLTLVFTVGGSASGVEVAGSLAHAQPSFWGGLMGGAVGAAAGVGMLKLLEGAGVDSGEGVLPFISYGIIQGVLAATGSGVGKWLRPRSRDGS